MDRITTHKVQADSFAPGPPLYTHEPLDYTTRSIRLLRILPALSDAGLLQCQIWHDTVDAAYTCLSYVWGSEKGPRRILINGGVFSIRKNLWDFLQVARTKYASPSHTFWIDALCINQELVEEKNHQVSQMGPIYRNAVEVIAWLGRSEGMGRAFTYALEIYALRGDNLPYLWSERNLGLQLRNDWLEVIHNQYWKRAWITQEILLAHRVRLLVNNMEVEARRLSTMRGLLGYINTVEPRRKVDFEHWTPGLRLFQTYLDAMCGRTPFREQKLTTLFHELPGRQSERPRDRIYSLLSIAANRGRLPVDYGCSDIDVLLHIVRMFQTSMCVCLWLYLVTTLEYRIDAAPGGGFGTRMPVFEIPFRVPDTQFFGGVGLTDWYNDCAACMSNNVDLDQTARLFCLQDLCNCCTAGTHVCLKRYQTSVGQSYTIRRCDSMTELDVIQVEVDGYSEDAFNRDFVIPLDNGEDQFSAALFRIWLTADMLTQLLRHDTLDKVRETRLQICLSAREERGKLVCHNTQSDRVEDGITTLNDHNLPISRSDSHVTQARSHRQQANNQDMSSRQAAEFLNTSMSVSQDFPPPRLGHRTFLDEVLLR
jgi:hypothetical protein